MIKTIKQFSYNKSRCGYCKGTGVDTFNHTMPCPNCSTDTVVMTRREKDELINEKIHFEQQLNLMQ